MCWLGVCQAGKPGGLIGQAQIPYDAGIGAVMAIAYYASMVGRRLASMVNQEESKNLDL